jgi:hypothetical protein
MKAATALEPALELATHPDRFLATTQIASRCLDPDGRFWRTHFDGAVSLRLELVPLLAGYRESIAFSIVVISITYVSLVRR